ncbi:MAG: acyl-CoA dehydrogenase family protein [Acidimicrobiia bacterium]|nr:acyl-CoA dehydrogenase family protein [Acidimicrobiia bacterium]
MLIYESDVLSDIRTQARRFVEERVVPHADEWEEEGLVPRQVMTQMGDLGFFSLGVSEADGGLGLGAVASAILAEELGRSTYGGFAITAIAHVDLAMRYLLGSGSPTQKERWLPGLMAGTLVGALGVTEPDAGSDVAGMRTTAKRDGDGFLINGAKMYITNGVHADVVFVAARTNPDAKASRGISIFGVEKGTEGFEVSRALRKMGWKSSDTAELSFQDCWVPESNVLGDLDSGFYQIMRNFQHERLVLGAMALGESSRAIELTLEYTKNRMAFGEPLWTKQAIRQRLAMRAAEVEAARQLIYHAAWLIDQGNDAVAEVSMVKAFMGELTNRVLYDCVQFHGGMGYISETAVERMYRDARIHSIGGGATEVMLEEIAKRL